VTRTAPLQWRTDDELIAAAKHGDRAAASVLLDRHYDRVSLISRRMMADPHDAEDATQQALIAIVRGLGGFDGRAAATTWIHRVTVNACLDELRRRARRPQPVDHAAVRETAGDAPDVATSVVNRTVIDVALGALAPEFRAAVVLRDICALDYDQIAEVLGIPAGTVRSRISRGRRDLRASLGNQPDSDVVEESGP